MDFKREETVVSRTDDGQCCQTYHVEAPEVRDQALDALSPFFLAREDHSVDHVLRFRQMISRHGVEIAEFVPERAERRAVCDGDDDVLPSERLFYFVGNVGFPVRQDRMAKTGANASDRACLILDGGIHLLERVDSLLDEGDCPT